MTKIVLAGWPRNLGTYSGIYRDLPREVLDNFEFFLTAYSPTDKTNFPKTIAYMESLGIRGSLIADSGAFTAWTLGSPVDLNSYLDWIFTEVRPCLEAFNQIFVVGLDEIPGRFLEVPSESEFFRATEVTLQNCLKMRASGVEPIPIHHQGEPLSLIGDYLDAGFTYLGISPRHGKPVNSQAKYAGEVFRYLVRDRKTPLDRFPALHSFGKTSPEVLRACPFWTADSTTWLSGGRFGAIKKRSITRTRLSIDLRHHQEIPLKNKRGFLVRESLKNELQIQNQFLAYWNQQGIKIIEPSGAFK